jgi:hypothetical protein
MQSTSPPAGILHPVHPDEARDGRWPPRLRQELGDLEPCGMSGHNCFGVTSASHALAARTASSRSISLLPACRNSGGKPRKSANSGETSGSIYW